MHALAVHELNRERGKKQMLHYKRRRKPENVVSPGESFTKLQETELVLKLKKEELFDPHILLPHAELNSIVYQSVNTFVEKYKGKEMSLLVYSDPVNTLIQDSFREVYASHYREELLKVNRYLMRHLLRTLALVAVGIIALVTGMSLTRRYSNETVLSYIILNISGFCLWEIGYTQFSIRNVVDEKKRITRALNARIEFQ